MEVPNVVLENLSFSTSTSPTNNEVIADGRYTSSGDYYTEADTGRHRQTLPENDVPHRLVISQSGIGTI
jgi:hypothetical protein